VTFNHGVVGSSPTALTKKLTTAPVFLINQRLNWYSLNLRWELVCDLKKQVLTSQQGGSGCAPATRISACP
jgi:hypothetical protein